MSVYLLVHVDFHFNQMCGCSASHSYFIMLLPHYALNEYQLHDVWSWLKYSLMLQFLLYRCKFLSTRWYYWFFILQMGPSMRCFMMSSFLEDCLSEDLEMLPTVTLPPASLTFRNEFVRRLDHLIIKELPLGILVIDGLHMIVILALTQLSNMCKRYYRILNLYEHPPQLANVLAYHLWQGKEANSCKRMTKSKVTVLIYYVAVVLFILDQHLSVIQVIHVCTAIK